MADTAKPTGLALLREPFPSNQISKLPKPTAKQTQEVKDDFKKGIRCQLCGAWHHKDVVHLDYVGHAALTDRLLDCDPAWNWEPVAFGADGLPAIDSNGGMWIRLTVCGQSRLGYGHPDNKKGGDAIKETIGDTLRNAAMRFGAALDLWHKGDLHGDTEADDAQVTNDATPQKNPPPVKQSPSPTQIADKLIKRFGEMATLKDLMDFTEPETPSGKAWADLVKNHASQADRVQIAFNARKTELKG